MSNEEESLLALLQESLGNGQRTNAPIIINNNYFNAPSLHTFYVEKRYNSGKSCIFAAKFYSNTYLLWQDQSEKPPC